MTIRLGDLDVFEGKLGQEEANVMAQPALGGLEDVIDPEDELAVR